MSYDQNVDGRECEIMSYQQKAAALEALSEFSIKFRKPGDWYVSQNVEIGGDGCLTGSYGNGASPEDAINDHWGILTGIPYGKYLVTKAYQDERKHWRWNGFMWQQLPIKATS